MLPCIDAVMAFCPFRCIFQICGKKLSNKYKLRYHMAVHTEVRNLKCGTCGMKFKGRDNLLKHVAKFHQRSELTRDEDEHDEGKLVMACDEAQQNNVPESGGPDGENGGKAASADNVAENAAETTETVVIEEEIPPESRVLPFDDL